MYLIFMFFCIFLCPNILILQKVNIQKRIVLAPMNEKIQKENEKIFKEPLKIGDLTLPTRVLPAPMAGISERAFRDLLRRFGCGLVYTEMISAEGLVRGGKKTWDIMDIDGEDFPVAIQIFGSSAEVLTEAGRIAEAKGATLLDLNLGCPVRKVVNSQSGSALLRNPDYLRKIFSSIRKAVKIPLTIKMRSGFGDNPRAAFEIAPIAEGEGIDAICLHPRTREQFFKGSSDWSQIAEMKSLIKIPLIGNGDIFSAEDAVKMVKETGCDAIMIGRGALGRPWIFENIIQILEKAMPLESVKEPSFSELIEIIRLHYRFIISRKPERKAIREMRKHIIYYFKGFPYAKDFRAKWMGAESFKEVESLLSELSKINPPPFLQEIGFS